MIEVRQLCINEFGLLIRGGAANSLAASSIPESDWDWLLSNEHLLTTDAASIFRPAIKQGRHVLQVLNYVGVISLPSGAHIEILPKISEAGREEDSRRQLFKMLAAVNDLPSVEFYEAPLKTTRRPLLEVLIGRFLADVQHLINRGLRSHYVTVESNEPFLKGRLRASEYLMLPPEKRMIFPIQYDDYVLSRPENRLLHWAVNVVYHWSQVATHRSHARKLLSLLAPIPMSVAPLEDLKAWRNEKLMHHYSSVKAWVTLIVQNLSPWTQLGKTQGVSLLFPMERLFEKYVCRLLRGQLQQGYSLCPQYRAGFLAEHQGRSWFALEPDITIKKNNLPVGVLDTKWKALNSAAIDKRYEISQADIYQLFAYGKQCIPAGGPLLLIYPRSSRFSMPLPEFVLGSSHKLWAVPFCLERDKLMGGDWLEAAPFLSGCVEKVPA